MSEVNIQGSGGHLSLRAGGLASVIGVDAGLILDAPPNISLQGMFVPPGVPNIALGSQRIGLPVTTNQPDGGDNTRFLGYERFVGDTIPLVLETGYLA